MGLGQHLSFANVAAGTALVVALGGGGLAVAAVAKNSVGSAQIVNSSIKGKDVKDGKLTGKDIKESTLAGVASAASVDTVRHLTANPVQGQSVPLLTRGALTLTASCAGSPGTGLASLQMTTAVDHARWVTSNNQDEDFTVADGAAGFGQVSNGIAQILVSATTPSGEAVHVMGHATASGTQCRVDIVVVG
ncbi:hypothetical protein [Nocardioides sp.]|uniref:hypothetical protein n=1 Tax=Nocardioides sp. TaxID=35761 RepID=UPI001A27D85E|nr:hypothetical protein [Nocardioides sp.]MBJ7359499.1 hypothetical protein [Nocardioides sp.]